MLIFSNEQEAHRDRQESADVEKLRHTYTYDTRALNKPANSAAFRSDESDT